MVSGAAFVYGFLGSDTVEARARVYSGSVKRGGAYTDAFSLATGECDIGAGEWLVVGAEFAVVGDRAISGGSAWCGGKKVTCCWAVLEEGDEGFHGFGCWGPWWLRCGVRRALIVVSQGVDGFVQYELE